MNDRLRELEKNTLGKMSINELRNIGRSVGVKCPTNATKEDLVEGILGIVLGEDGALDETRGRPTDGFYAYSCSMEPDMESLSSGMLATTNFSECKIYDLLNHGLVVVENNERFVVNFALEPKSKMKLCSELSVDLKTGDTVSFLVKDGEAIVIEYLGRFLVEEEKAENYDAIGIIYPNAKYRTIEEVDVLAPVAKGSRTLVFDDSVMLDSLHLKMVQGLTKRMSPPTVVAFCYEISDEDFAKISTIAGVKVRVSETDCESDINFKLNILNEFIKRSVEFGTDTVIYFPGIYSLSRMGGIDGLVQDELVKLIKMCGRYKNDATVTTIINCTSVALFETLSTYSTNIIVTSGDDEFRIEPELSETMFKESFLTIKEIEKLDYARKNWYKMSKKEKHNLIFR